MDCHSKPSPCMDYIQLLDSEICQIWWSIIHYRICLRIFPLVKAGGEVNAHFKRQLTDIRIFECVKRTLLSSNLASRSHQCGGNMSFSYQQLSEGNLPWTPRRCGGLVRNALSLAPVDKWPLLSCIIGSLCVFAARLLSCSKRCLSACPATNRDSQSKHPGILESPHWTL